MRRVLIALPILAVLALAPAALAGGWATVALDSTPDGTAPGQKWDVNITVLQHGRTPLDGVKPTVTISSGDSSKTFSATPTGKPGVYRAVAFMRPHFQLDELGVAMRLVAELPPPAS